METSEINKTNKNIPSGSSESKKLKALIEHSDVMLWSVKEDETGEYFYEQVNEAFALTSGLKPIDYNSKNIKDVNTEEEITDIKKLLARAKKNGVYNYHKERTVGSEKKYYIQRIIYVSGEGNQDYYIGSGVDVTELILTEDKLRISEKKYLDLAKYAPLAITRVNIEADKFEFVNDEFVRLSGYTMDEYNSLERENYLKLLYEEDRDGLVKSYENWMLNGYKGIFRYEYRFINKQNRILWLDVFFHGEADEAGKVRTINQIYIDITDRKLSEEKVNLLAHALESTAEMISITDLNNCIIFANKAFLQGYGYTKEEIIGKNIKILGSDRNEQNIHTDILYSTIGGIWSGELWNKTKDGNEFPVLLNTSRIFDSNGRVVGLIGVAVDISERKKMEEKLRHMLKEKEILLKEVYHRVKNNLQVINSLLHIQSHEIKDNAAKEMIKEAQTRIKLMSGIHEKLYRTKDFTKIDFSGYIKDLTDNLKSAYPVNEKQINLIIESHDINLGVDKAIPCGLIINELVSNAYKYAFEGKDKGSIFIKLYTDETGKYVLEVQDDGIGLPQKIDFREADTLGMSLVTTLTSQMDGEIEMINKNGVKFIIKFN
ncbi:MAG: PAS domain S-box protein [Ignavibacteriae bacterium]|nr:MAG: PAS domain S-box protein [Ignavibacteriota bacterium]